MRKISRKFNEQIVTRTVILKKYDIKYLEEFQELVSKNYNHIFSAAEWANKLETKEDCKDYFKSSIFEWEQKTTVSYMIIERSTSKLVGDIRLFDIDFRKGKAEISKWIGKEFTGKGYAKDAQNSLIDNFFKKGLLQIKSSINRDNITSQNFAIKNGFKEQNPGLAVSRLIFIRYNEGR